MRGTECAAGRLLCLVLLSASGQVRSLENANGEWVVIGTPEFSVNWLSDEGDRLFHFNMRPSLLVMNSKAAGGNWGQEATISHSLDKATWIIKVDQDGFQVRSAVQEPYLFEHRLPWSSFSYVAPGTGDPDVSAVREICGPGSTVNATGYCTSCEAGTYQIFNGSWPCSMCPSNSNSPPGSDEPTDCVCNAGYTGPDGGACQHCTANTYKPQNGPSACFPCPSNSQSSLEASTRVTDCICNAGYSGPDGGPCTACNAGSAKAGVGDGNCTICPAGTYAEGRAWSECYYCWWGKYGLMTNQTSKELCLQCPHKYTTSQFGSTAVADCTCIPGTTGPAGGKAITPLVHVLRPALKHVMSSRNT